ncbi:hypothetical protein SAMD00019534_117730, partial [Acytostelium subglobosum LB1]|uniref:hypothetical protein n=1 Tax=Acytostelium subglobosum LB1 TaxID=1410327 RepID=UPI000644C16B
MDDSTSSSSALASASTSTSSSPNSSSSSSSSSTTTFAIPSIIHHLKSCLHKARCNILPGHGTSAFGGALSNNNVVISSHLKESSEKVVSKSSIISLSVSSSTVSTTSTKAPLVHISTYPPDVQQQQHQQQQNDNTDICLLFTLPTEMLVYLISFLPARTLLGLSKTGHRFWNMIDSFKFWDRLFDRNCPKIYYAMQHNSRWTTSPPQVKMLLCLMDDLPAIYTVGTDVNDERAQIQKIMGIMSYYTKNPLIQRETCYILKRLSYRQRKEDEHEAIIAKYHGIKHILDAMRDHPFNCGVQEDACGALGNLTCDVPNSFGQ